METEGRECAYHDHQRRLRCTECGLFVVQCQCEDVEHNAHHRLWGDDGKMIRAIRGEIGQHREAFPNTHYLMAGLVEATGDLMKSLIQQQIGNRQPAEVFHEAVKVAALAVRMGTEGDPDFPYEPYAVFGEESSST